MISLSILFILLMYVLLSAFIIYAVSKTLGWLGYASAITKNRIKIVTFKTMALLFPSFIAYWYFTAPPAGFCVAQNRVLADVEFLNNVSDARRYNKDQKFENGKYSVLNCCTISRIEGDFWSKMFRVDEGVAIGWAYERKKAEPTNPKEDKYFLVTATFNSCNTKLLNGTGITEKSLPNYDSAYSKYDNY